jgi:activator of HSP90 ATPase
MVLVLIQSQIWNQIECIGTESFLPHRFMTTTTQTGTNWKNVNNWHWVDKNCMPWAKQYFTDLLKGKKVEHNGFNVSVTEVTEVTGDCDLNQRKGQIISIFDIQLKLKWQGFNEKGTEATGTIEIPEYMHDSKTQDIVVDISLDSGNREKEDIKEVARTKLAPVIRECFSHFTADLMSGKDDLI